MAEITPEGIVLINYSKSVGSSSGNRYGIKDFITAIKILDEVNITLTP